MYSHSENSLTEENHARHCPGKKVTNLGRYSYFHNNPQRLPLTRCDVGQAISIDMLPDGVLVEVFQWYIDEASVEDECAKKAIEAWHLLVHVCWRWRCIVFGSPCSLDVRLLCTAKTPARDTLDVWPPYLPLSIWCEGDYRMDNVTVILECSERVDEIELFDVGSHLETVAELMQEPFPELTTLVLHSDYDETVPVLPDSFLGRSAPCLEFLYLNGIPFPGSPKPLLSATHLVNLYYDNILILGTFHPR
jgi:hypothetical protein